ncbi:MAG: AMP-binding protein, partial [Nitrospinae bacterium]|nr:AMP-binding protein [Nitrospinota bacterium]
MKIKGFLKETLLRKSINNLAKRHILLKAKIIKIGEETYQEIVNKEVDFQCEDIVNSSEEEIQEKLFSLSQQAFDDKQGSLMRVNLLRKDTDLYYLLCTFHRVIFDNLSTAVFYNELPRIYKAEEDSDFSLPEVKSTYVDFIDWQEKMVPRRKGTSQKKYWDEKLSGKLNQLNLSIENYKPAIKQFNGKEFFLKLNKTLSKEIKTIAFKENVNTSSFLLCAFNMLLSHYAKQEEIIVVTPYAGRSKLEFLSVVGNFTNYLPIRSFLKSNDTVKGVLHQVQKNFLEAMHNGDYPFREIIRELEVKNKELVDLPFRIAFNMNDWKKNIKPVHQAKDEVNFLPLINVHQVEAFDLFLEVTEVKEEFQLVFKYNASCFETGSIKEMATFFEVYISSMVKNLDQKVSQLLRIIEEREILSLPPLTILQERGMVPLSFAQEKFFLLQTIHPESGQFNLSEAIKITGEFDKNMVQNIFKKVLDRYEIVRSTFWNEEGFPVQLIMLDYLFTISSIDLQAMPESDRLAEVQKSIEEEIWTPFNLLECPLLRVTVYSINPDEHILLLVVHPIIGDYRSLTVILEDFTKAYKQKIMGNDIELINYRVQFADYTAWKKKIFNSELFVQQLNYWRRVLRNIPGCLQLPTDFKRPTIKSGKGAQIQFDLGAEITEGIFMLSKKEEVTPFMVTITALYILLNRYSGEQDICIGTPYDNRNFREIKRLIGCFENTIALRIQSDPKQSFTNLLKEVKTVVMDAFKNCNIPFEKVIDTVKPTRSLAFSPLFQVVFHYRKKPLFEPKDEKVFFEQFAFDSKKSDYDLEFVLTETTRSFKGFLRYSTDLFEEETAKLMVNRLKMILSKVIQDQSIKLLNIPLIEKEKKEEILNVWGRKNTNYKVDTTIHEQFAKEVNRSSDAIAISYEEKSVSYKLIDTMSNQIAHHLVKKGLKKGDVAAIYMDTSIEMIAVILGILKVGGCCLPLNPKTPDKRIGIMFNDFKVNLLIKPTRKSNSFDKKAKKIVFLETSINKISNEKKEPIKSEVSVKDTAFIYYVSGANGKPKGMEVSHFNLMRLFKATEELFQLKDEHVWALLSNSDHISFVWEMLGALLYGGKLVIVPPEKTTNQSLFYDVLERNKVTFLNCSHGFFKEFMSNVAELKEGKELSLKNITLGRGQLDYKAFIPWFEKFGETKPSIYNMFGLTETSGFAAVYRLNQKDLKENRGSIIGKPLSGGEFYILDKRLKPQPVGVPGEIFIGGAGVVSSYRKRPVMNKNRFLSNPFSSKGETFYKTGDYGKWNHEGQIELLGRKDRQVSLDGFRIELGDVETNLLKYKDIAKCAVFANETQPGNKKLAAFIQLNKDTTLDVLTLNKFLSQRLPEEMIPAQYFCVQFLLNAQGNVRKGLLTQPYQQPVQKKKTKSMVYLEKKLIEIWQQTLNQQKVERKDNFFKLCDDTMLSLVVSEKGLNEGLGLTPRHLFVHQTIEELSAALIREFPLIPEQMEIKGIIPLAPGVNSFFEEGQKNAHLQNESVLVEVPEEIHEHLINEMFDKIIAHHDILRSRFHITKDDVQHEILAYEEDPYFLAEDFSELTKKNFEKGIEDLQEKVQHSLDLSKGSLIRVCFVKTKEGYGNKVLIVVHRSLIDRLSWHTLLEDFMELCKQTLKNRSLRLPQKTTSYKRWSQNIKTFKKSLNIDKERAYWKKFRKQTVVSIPVEKSINKDNVHHSAQSITLSLYSLGTEKIFQKTNIKPEEIIITALLMAFNRFWGMKEVYLDYIENQRNEIVERQDLSRTIGNFYSSAPLALTTNKGDKAESILKMVQGEFKERPRNGMSFSLLKYSLGEAEKQILKDIPCPEISFIFEGEIEEFIPNLKGFKFIDKPNYYKHCGDSPREYFFNIRSYINCNKLYVDFVFNENCYTKEKIGRFAGVYIDCLRSVVDGVELPDPPEPIEKVEFKEPNQRREKLSEEIKTSYIPVKPEEIKKGNCPFYCFPDAMGNYFNFVPLVKELPEQQPFYTFESAQFNGNGEPFATIDEISEYYTANIMKEPEKGPYILGGHAFGGHIAVKVAEKLIKRGRRVGCLVAIDSWFPTADNLPVQRKRSKAHWIVELSKYLEELTGNDYGLSLEKLKHVALEGCLDILCTILYKSELLLSETDIKAGEKCLELFMGNMNALYTPFPEQIPVKTLLIKSQKASCLGSIRNGDSIEQETWGWSAFSTEKVDILELPGERASIFTELKGIDLVKKIGLIDE